MANRPRGIYLLPNLCTTLGLFFGVYALVCAIDHRFTQASMAVFYAMIADGLDGRIARLTQSESAFGVEYDSLADMVCFCLTPAIVTYLWAGRELGRLGWACAFIYIASGALRLARFNTQVASADKRFFQGLPVPAAAACLMGMVAQGEAMGIPQGQWRPLLLFLLLYLAFMMVSHFRYYSFKSFTNLPRHAVFLHLLLAILLISAVALDPILSLALGFFAYSLSGPIVTIVQRRALQKRPLGEKGEG